MLMAFSSLRLTFYDTLDGGCYEGTSGSHDYAASFLNFQNFTPLVSTVAVGTSNKADRLFEAAQVPHPKVSAKWNATQLLTCESRMQQPLSSCLWVRPNLTQKEGIFIPERVLNDGGRTNVDGISFVNFVQWHSPWVRH